MPESLLSSVIVGKLSIEVLFLCSAASLLYGFIIAAAYMYGSKYSKSLAVSLVIIPATVQLVIMLVNGNIGAGVAVAGAFSLVRFRSLPGSARDISCLFLAMAIGLSNGMGFLAYSFIFLILLCSVIILLTKIHFGEKQTDTRTLRITIPESLDYEGIFDEAIAKFATDAELDRVRTTNMGTMFELTYSVKLKTNTTIKAFVDELRCLNGNLNISLSREHQDGEEL